MATQALPVSGPIATIDPDLLRKVESLHKEVDSSAEKITPVAKDVVRVIVDRGIETSCDYCADRIKSKVSAQASEKGPIVNNSIDACNKVVTGTAQQAIRPMVDTCVVSSSDVVKRAIHDGIDRSAQNMSSCFSKKA